jgi:hypothetical protein
MIFFTFVFSLLLSSAYPCWKVQGELFHNQDGVKIHQKFDHDKSYSFGSSEHIFNLKLLSKFSRPSSSDHKKIFHLMEIQVMRKSGSRLHQVAEAKILLPQGEETTMKRSDDLSQEISQFTFKITKL